MLPLNQMIPLKAAGVIEPTNVGRRSCKVGHKRLDELRPVGVKRVFGQMLQLSIPINQPVIVEVC
jgi:hypothetical protein